MVITDRPLLFGRQPSLAEGEPPRSNAWLQAYLTLRQIPLTSCEPSDCDGVPKALA